MSVTSNPTIMNLELTTACPLHCPQCYCTLQGGKHIPLERAIYWISEAGRIGVKEVALSGGETMCYPHLYEVIKAAITYCGHAYVALSGYNLNQKNYQALLAAGITAIYISLNGSIEKVNKITRDGYDYALSALKLLSENKYAHTRINWVMHADNILDFPNMVQLADSYNVEELIIIGFKPDANHEMRKIPSFEQMKWLSSYLKTCRSKVKVIVEPCYSPFRAYILDTNLFGNLNVGVNKGCRAGLCSFSVNVDGNLTPCRHIDLSEDFTSLKEYWDKSEVLKAIRQARNEYGEPCKTCKYARYCNHCVAINIILHNTISFGYKECPIATPIEL